MGVRLQRVCVVLALAAWALPASAVEVGLTDTFADGAAGWRAGGAAVLPPVVVADGGRGGTGDAFLRVGAVGGGGPSSRLTVIAGPQWAGDYLAAGIDAIAIDVINLGQSALDLRLWVGGSAGASSVSAAAFMLPVGSGWTRARFSLAEDALTGPTVQTLADVRELRLFHGASAAFPGGPIVASVGIDNVTAVPEPAVSWLMAGGITVIAALRRRQPRSAGRTGPV